MQTGIWAAGGLKQIPCQRGHLESSGVTEGRETLDWSYSNLEPK